MSEDAGQAAIEAIGGGLALLAAALVMWQVVVVLAAAGAAQAEVRRAAIASPGGGEGRVIVRRREVPSPLPGAEVEAVTAAAAVPWGASRLSRSDQEIP